MTPEMAGISLMLLWALAVSLVEARAIDLTKRDVLTDLSGGFCRSYRFGVDIADNTLYMVGLDGGIIPNDLNSSNNYLVTLDLTSSFSTSEGKNYKMSKLPNSIVPKIKDMALWANAANTTLYQYGGRYLEDITTDNAIWTYNVNDKSWAAQEGSVQPAQREYGVDTNAPEIQAAFWVGGYRGSGTTSTITDSTNDYVGGMIQLNTTTGQYTSLAGPYDAVQEGSLSYIPVGDMGILVYLGGEVPSVADGVNATLKSNSWDYVQVYDIATGNWYNQSTTGSVTSRTQFCASVQHDPSTSSYQIYAIGGADLESEDPILDINYLSIPSFKWFSAAPLDEARMTLQCATYGRQIFAVGGRLAWADDSEAGCYTMPAFIYDAQSEATRSTFDPSLDSFSLSSSTTSDIKESPYPSSWASPALKALFVSSTNTSESSTSGNSTSSSSTTTQQAESGTSHSSNTGAIAGGVVGGVAGLALIGALLWFFIVRNKRQERGALPTRKINELPAGEPPELSVGNPPELSAGNPPELSGGEMRHMPVEPVELSSERT
ncbi:hypothetical protein N7504_000603 [Penicillium tannophilum]|nr:hypothetical protein N7504_000603 [Penicillium tannophilum]